MFDQVYHMEPDYMESGFRMESFVKIKRCPEMFKCILFFFEGWNMWDRIKHGSV